MTIHQKIEVNRLDFPFAKKKEDVNNGDVVEILEESQQQPDRFNPGQFQTVIKIKTKNGARYIALNQTSENILIDVFKSNDDKDWIGKDAKILLKPGMFAGKKGIALYLVGLDWELDEYGEPARVGDQGEVVDGMPVIQEEDENFDPTDVPF
jgi:hypothetical protein